MTLVLHNTLTRKKEAFTPQDPKHVTMYVCGPTVYNFAHIGNARPYIVFDVLFRLLQTLYPKVTYARNITDIEDKIITAAKANNETIQDLTTRTEKIFQDDMASLHSLPPTVQPRATAHIPQMIQMIQDLIDKGHAYVAEGHVLFDVSSMPTYGQLSNRNQEDLIAGARVEVAPYKKNPVDFVLWKPSPADFPGWDSPWGFGRPGWHIECSAMAEEHLGKTIDLHAGGHDLIFPHHENEIAQSTCAHDGLPFATHWLHNGMLMVNGEKMSKSLGNFYTIRDVLKMARGEEIRFYMLTTHYRQPFDWTAEGLAQAKASVDRFYTALRSIDDIDADKLFVDGDVKAALLDDLNTPLALAHLHEIVKQINKSTSLREKARLKAALLGSCQLLGLLNFKAEAWFHETQGVDATAIETLIKERTEARQSKDFARADAIRQQLTDMGIVLEDVDGKTQWKSKSIA